MSWLLENAEGSRDDAGFSRGNQITEGNEGESVQAAIAEAITESAEVEREISDVETRGEADGETLQDLDEAVDSARATTNESAGLSPVEARLYAKTFARVVGQKVADRKMPNMESFASRTDSAYSTGFVSESIKETIKQFWEALKNKFKSIWTKIKASYTKWFSTARKTGERAKQIRDRANNLTTTIETRNFDFAQGSILHIDGKMRDPSAFITTLKTVSKIVETTNEVTSKGEADKFIDTLDKSTVNVPSEEQNKTKFDAAVFANVLAMGRILGGVVGEGNVKNIDPEIIKGYKGGSDSVVVSASEKLPGDKALLWSGKVDDKGGYVEVLRTARLSFVNLKKNPREIKSLSAATLNVSQISDICDIIESSSGDIYEYEKNITVSDKAHERVTRELDSIAKEIESDYKSNEDDENVNAQENNNSRRAFRTLSSALTNYINRMNNIPALTSGYALPVYAAALNWCEGSMKHYKK